MELIVKGQVDICIDENKIDKMILQKLKEGNWRPKKIEVLDREKIWRPEKEEDDSLSPKIST
jgi:hypothetical protein